VGYVWILGVVVAHNRLENVTLSSAVVNTHPVWFPDQFEIEFGYQKICLFHQKSQMYVSHLEIHMYSTYSRFTVPILSNI